MEGRFISKDPIGISSGVNSYSYTRNNPINLKDPSGLIDTQFKFTLGVGGGVGEAVNAGIFSATINEITSGKSCNYRVSCLGLGVGLPQFNIKSKPTTFSTNKCMNCSDFEGYGRMESISLVVGVGFNLLSYLQIPNGPDIRVDFDWDYGGLNVGITSSKCYFRCLSGR